MAGWPSTYSYGYPSQGYTDPNAAYYAQYGYSGYPGYNYGYQQPAYQPPAPQPQPVPPSYNTQAVAEPPQDNFTPPPRYEEPAPQPEPAKKRTWLGRIWSFAWRAAIVVGAFMAGQMTAGPKDDPKPTTNVNYNISTDFFKYAADPGDANKLGAATPVHLVNGTGDDVLALEIDKGTGTAKLVNPTELALPSATGKTKTDAGNDFNLPANATAKALRDRLVATFQKLTPPAPGP